MRAPGGRLHGGDVVVAGGVFAGADEQAVDEEIGEADGLPPVAEQLKVGRPQ